MDLLGEPRLVRLNPNIPWKTRGNAALAARFGHGRGTRRTVGRLHSQPVRAYSRGAPTSESETAELVSAAWRVVRTGPPRGPGTDPGLVASPRRLPVSLYWEAVRRVIAPSEVDALLDRPGITVRTAGNGRGRIGAAAALAWAGSHPTWEVIAYRSPDRWGTAREVEAASIDSAARNHPELFLCRDPQTRRLLVVPHTSCPVLFGLRSSRPTAACEALEEIRSEPVDRWMLFRTNQATGDHVRRPMPGTLRPFSAGALVGHVSSVPSSRPGGHVEFSLARPDATPVACLVFEPTKTLPRLAQRLAVGDRLRVWGGCGSDTRFRVEGIEVMATSPRWIPGPNPVCLKCGGRARSLGTGRGFRCRRCGSRWPPESRSQRAGPAPPEIGTYHPTPSARRHLAPRAPGSGVRSNASIKR